MADLKLIITGDNVKVLQSLEGVIRRQGKMIDKLKATTKASKKAGAKQIKAFGPSALSALGGYAAGLGTIAAALGVAKKLLGDVAEKSKSAFEGFKPAESSFSKLAQLAAGSQDKFLKLTQASREVFREGGARNLEEAGKVVFELESAGALDERAFFSRLAGIEDVAPLVKAAGVLRSAVGAKETGSFQDITSKAIAASTPVTGVSAAQILEGSARGAATASLLGLSDEELLAATSVVSQSTGSAELGGTQVNALLTALVKKGISAEFPKGTELEVIIKDIKQRGLSDQGLIQLFGRIEAFKAFSVLAADPQRFSLRKTAVEEAQESGLAQKTIAIAESDPVVSKIRDERISAAQELLSREKQGLLRAEVETLQDRLETAGRESGVSEVGLTIGRSAQDLVQFLRGDKVAKEDFTRAIQELNQSLAGFKESSDRMAEAADRLGTGGKTLVPVNVDK